MDTLLKPGRIMFAAGILAFSILCFIYKDFIIGRPPAWTAEFTVNPALAYISASVLTITVMAMLFRRYAGTAALIIAVLILLLSVLRHLPNFMKDWVNGYKAIALAGGALIVASYFFNDDRHITLRLQVNERWGKGFLTTGIILLAVFLIACGFAHFKRADGVQYFVPAYIPFRLFWTYFCGACLLAGGLGLLVLQTRSLTAFLSV